MYFVLHFEKGHDNHLALIDFDQTFKEICRIKVDYRQGCSHVFQRGGGAINKGPKSKLGGPTICLPLSNPKIGGPGPLRHIR